MNGIQERKVEKICLHLQSCSFAGSTESFFATSNFSLYQRMWSAMESAEPSVFVKTNKEGEERVAKSKRMYAYLMESVSIEYIVERNCNLTQVGGLLDSKGYGIAMPVSKFFFWNLISPQ